MTKLTSEYQMAETITRIQRLLNTLPTELCDQVIDNINDNNALDQMSHELYISHKIINGSIDEYKKGFMQTHLRGMTSNYEFTLAAIALEQTGYASVEEAHIWIRNLFGYEMRKWQWIISPPEVT